MEMRPRRGSAPAEGNTSRTSPQPQGASPRQSPRHSPRPHPVHQIKWYGENEERPDYKVRSNLGGEELNFQDDYYNQEAPARSDRHSPSTRRLLDGAGGPRGAGGARGARSPRGARASGGSEAAPPAYRSLFTPGYVDDDVAGLQIPSVAPPYPGVQWPPQFDGTPPKGFDRRGYRLPEEQPFIYNYAYQIDGIVDQIEGFVGSIRRLGEIAFISFSIELKRMRAIFEHCVPDHEIRLYEMTCQLGDKLEEINTRSRSPKTDEVERNALTEEIVAFIAEFRAIMKSWTSVSTVRQMTFSFDHR